MATILNNSATATYNSGESTGSAASNVVSTTLLDSYGLEVQKFTANDSWRPGENITYLVTVTNTGTQPLSGVEVRDDLSGESELLAYVENSARLIVNDNVEQVTPTSVDPLVIPVAQTLQSGESVVVLYVAQVSASVGDEVQEITNTVQAFANRGDEESEVVQSQVDSVTIPREDFAQIDIIKSVDKAVISSGDNLTYTFTIENSGNIPATSVVITDRLPEGFAITSVQSETNGVVTVFDEEDYTVSADNTLILPTGDDVAIFVPARTESGNGITVVTVAGVVTG